MLMPAHHTRPTSSLATTTRLAPTIPAHATHGLPSAAAPR